MTIAAKPLGIALSGPHLVALIDDRTLAGALNASGLAFAIAGVDRIDGTHPEGATLESTTAVAKLTALAPQLGWLPAAAVHRDHPYNLARRVASLDHLSGGRVGLVLGAQDGYAPRLRDGHEVWGGAGLTEGVPVGIATTRDAALAIQELWQSWPESAIIADKSTGIYARGHQIRRIDHHGVFDIAGPLPVPTTPQGTPVFAWRIASLEEAAAARDIADILVVPAELGAEIDRLTVVPGAAAIYVEVSGSGAERVQSVERLRADGRVDGIVLRPTGEVQALPAVLSELPALLTVGELRGSRTLRDRLGLPSEPAVRLGNTVAAFPEPDHRLARV